MQEILIISFKIVKIEHYFMFDSGSFSNYLISVQNQNQVFFYQSILHVRGRRISIYIKYNKWVYSCYQNE